MANLFGLPRLARARTLVLYGSAKAYREALELQGFQMAESYDQFVRRVTAELEI